MKYIIIPQQNEKRQVVPSILFDSIEDAWNWARHTLRLCDFMVWNKMDLTEEGYDAWAKLFLEDYTRIEKERA